jgi:hypothetical protein
MRRIRKEGVAGSNPAPGSSATGQSYDRAVAAADTLSDLPGSEIVLPGLEDLAAGRDTPNASAVLMASARLSDAGIAVPKPKSDYGIASHRLYKQLQSADAVNAHSRHNAIARRVLSFVQAAERARRG